ncbi:alcohol dehydrogenase catalytic domain-containing protein [Arthrobacter castelli]|uniref:alcohol dehydrogenase catalytic domain-containing protein n=1 Tax=Arthrobacter castelli TaxID=271431 RepID=UPI001B7FEBA6|nr:zinc-binding dehydrogenase [Arthrobacter castelli]
MRAACLTRSGVVEVRDFDEPRPGPGDAVVRMHYASICGSDVHTIYDGFHNPELLGRPGYPGHEGVGTVVESRTDQFPAGTPVLTTPPGEAGGCFGELQRVNEQHLLALPADGDMLRLLMAQQLGTTVYALKKFITPERLATMRSAAIIGAGSAGLFFVQQLRRMGVADIVVSDLNPQRLKHAARLGATRTVPGAEESLREVVSEAFSDDGVDVVIEAAG